MLWVVPAVADTSQEVTITATGWIAGAPTGFTITYVNDHQLDLSWVKGEDADNTMVRAKYGSYPSSYTDGYQVYYGAGTSTSDTAVSVDETGTGIYYRLFSEAGGVWVEDVYAEGFWEGIGMTLIAFFILCGILSFLSLRNRSALLAIGASGAWLFMLAYTRSNLPGGITAGDSADTIMVLTFIALAIAMPFMWIQRRRVYRGFADSDQEESETVLTDDIVTKRKSKSGLTPSDISRSRSSRHGASGTFADSAEEYQARVHNVLRSKRRRR